MKKHIFLILTLIISNEGFSQFGPAGVGTVDGTSDLEYWIYANTNVTGSTPITFLGDNSGNGVVNTINGTPSLATGVVNGYDAITFDGTGDFIGTNLDIAPSVFPNLTVLAVYQPRINDAGGVWGGDNGAGWDRLLIDAQTTAAVFNSCVSNGLGPESSIPNIFPLGSYVVTTIIFEEDIPNGSLVYANGNLEHTFSSDHGPEPHTNLEIGEIGTSGAVPAFDFDGDISEVIIIGRTINEAERIIVENYLSAKYDINLGTNNLFNQDEFVNGNYDHNVAGIGRVDPTNLQNDAQGTGIVRILNPSGLDDDEFLIWGHDNGEPLATNTTDIPAGVLARFDRVWRVNEVNSFGVATDVGTIDLRYDLTGLGSVTPSDLRLLIDSNNDGIFSDETPIAGATSIGSNIYQFSSVTAITNNLRFTLATINTSRTPLPIELVSFDAKNIHDKYVKLEWQTATEINNDYFTIERSQNGKKWESIETIFGAGNSSTLLFYSLFDYSPNKGVSYYRLKQTDFDGTYSYSPIKALEINPLSTPTINIYPNPAYNEITITGNSVELKHMIIYNLIGQNITDEITMISRSENNLVLDLQNLKSGIYYVKTKTTATKVYKQ